MKHLLQCFGQNQNFPRIRLGIGPQPNGTALEDYVLAPYNSQQQTQLPELLSRAVQSIDVFLTQGLTVAQNYCNT
jgi:PTH1 family peptidyl-tRNA hydrolase